MFCVARRFAYAHHLSALEGIEQGAFAHIREATAADGDKAMFELFARLH